MGINVVVDHDCGDPPTGTSRQSSSSCQREDSLNALTSLPFMQASFRDDGNDGDNKQLKRLWLGGVEGTTAEVELFTLNKFFNILVERLTEVEKVGNGEEDDEEEKGLQEVMQCGQWHGLHNISLNVGLELKDDTIELLVGSVQQRPDGMIYYQK